MNPALPTVLIYGVDHFVAKKLAMEILSKDMNVLGVGSWVTGLGDMPNFKYVADIAEVGSDFGYVFDFVGSDLVWKKATEVEAKVTVICCNNKERSVLIKEKLIEQKNNWRMVESYGVYGPGMREKGFLAQALVKAVKNENLVLPPVSDNYRLLVVDDLVEAILRATFLSGTEKQSYLIVGEEITSREVAEVLIEEGKMTRVKVMESEVELSVWDEAEVEDNWEKLRWRPKISFSDGVGETLRYFFAKIDDESRKGIVREEVDTTIGWRKMEVVVEDDGASMVQHESDSGVPVVEEEIEPIKKQDEKKELKVEAPLAKEEDEDWGDALSVVKRPKKKKRKVKKKKVVEMVVENEDDWYAEEDLVTTVNDSEPSVEEVSPTREVVKRRKVSKIIETVTGKLGRVLERKKNKKREIRGSKGRLRWWWVVSLGVLAFLIVPAIWIKDSWWIYGNVAKTRNLIMEKRYGEAEDLVERTMEKVKKMNGKIDEWGLNKAGIFRNYQSVLRVGEDILGLELEVIGLADVMEKVSGAVFGETEIGWDEELPVLEEKLTELEILMGVLQARLKGDWGWLPPRWRSMPQNGVRELEKIRKVVGLSTKGIEILPEFLGVDGKRREYLVLLQNEMELRPGGGFIGSFGILSFEGGQLLNFEVKDVYEADGQLKGHVEPPEEIKKYLGEASWYLRDANWDADFLVTAQKVKWFLQKETGREVDGVIGVNLAVARAILGAVGEVYVADFKEKINEGNLYEQAQFWSETKFFPGSNQKASFLGGLSGQLFEEIKILSTEKRLALFESIIEMFENNEIQISMNEEEAGEVLAGLGWDGSMWEGSCAMDRCLADYLYIVEANVGVNKANYFLYRNIEQLVDISERSVLRVLRINYENISKNNNWPGGDYKNYMRVYLPLDVNLAQVSLMDGNNEASKKIYSGSELKIGEVRGKKEIGFLMTVPTGEKRIVEIRYSTEVNLAGSDKFSYLHYVQRQSGFGDTGLVTLISVPEGWQPLQVEPVASMVSDKLLFNQKLDKDMKMGVELSK